MTLFIYCFLCLMAFCFIFIQKKYLLNYVFVFFCLMGWSIVARFNSIQQDLIVYSEAMSYNWDFYKSLYVLREPIYWITSKILYDFFKEPIFVFIIWDAIIFSLFIYIAYKKNLKPYFILVFILFFPNVMGFLNVYRQYISTIFLFLSFLLVYENHIKSKFFYLTSFLSHNVGAIFLPLIFIRKKFFQSKFVLTSIISIFAMIFLSSSKSEIDTGETSPLLFFAVVCTGMLIFLSLNKLILYRKNIDLYYVNMYCVFISLFSVLFLSDAPAKRICMIALIFILYSIYWFIEDNKKNILVFRAGLVLVTLLPTFIFSSVFNMLVYAGK
ncbi:MULTISPECIES: EpsG family protein [Acinetobacter calcoaceticus/baumannii complex]|uniref:EpsG family protein n=1 Tax=Acinetobacter TaxID=469 RepID=UPI000447FFB2|nr:MULTISPECIES: EpsG family protein [Acinetobacter calcoaceticus/baumannii complex]EXS27477.1 putative membrane protein [Acinetobacter sp. 742879]MDX8164647.1 EpsG family protein [Acinetobacter pittii]